MSRNLIEVFNDNLSMVVIPMGGYSVYIQPKSKELIPATDRPLPPGVHVVESSEPVMLTEEDKRASALTEEVIEVVEDEVAEEVKPKRRNK